MKLWKAAVQKKIDKTNKLIDQGKWREVIKDQLCKGINLKGQTKVTYKENIPEHVLALARHVHNLKLRIKIKKRERKENIKMFAMTKSLYKKMGL